MFDSMVSQLQNFKLKMKTQAVPVSDISLSKITYQRIFGSSDLISDLVLCPGDFLILQKFFQYRPLHITPSISDVVCHTSQL